MIGYEHFIGKHKGEFAFILGAGLSLSDHINQDYFENLDKYVTISVNSSVDILPWMTGNADKRYWVSNDSATRYWSYWPKVLKAHANKIIRTSWKEYYDELNPSFFTFDSRVNEEKGITFGEKRLCGTSSIPTAIDLAIQMGCEKIFLVGVDHYFRGNNSHYWQLRPRHKWLTTTQYKATFAMQRRVFTQNLDMYKILKEYAKSNNSSILNCNKKSLVRCYEYVELKDILW